MPTLNQIIKVLNKWAMPYLAEEWDNVGLLIGSKNSDVKKVLCALDLTEEVVREAIGQKVQCIITHHPFIFKPINYIDFESSQGSILKQLIKNDIAVFAMHTNFDSCKGGTSDIVSQLVGIQDLNILKVTHVEDFCKFVVYVPEESYESVREAIIAVDHEHIGNYKGCTFTTKGEGTFIPLEGSNPYIGKQQTLEKVNERKIECIIAMQNVASLMDTIKKVHPYEEIAYDVYPLENLKKYSGLGRYGKIKPIEIKMFIEQIKEIFKIPYVRVIGNMEKTVERVAVCTGSGSSFLKEAAENADIYITGDLGFHDGQEAIARGLTVIDVGHYASENITVPFIKQYLDAKNLGIEVICSEVDGEVFHIV